MAPDEPEVFKLADHFVAVTHGDERGLWRGVQRVRRIVAHHAADRAAKAARNTPKPPKAERPFCGAKTRSGAPCKARVFPQKSKCRMHGGLSTGPRTPEGRTRIAEAQRRRWRWRERP